MTVNAQTLLDALTAYDQATAHAAALRSQLGDLEARDGMAMDAVANLEAIMDAKLGAFELGEATAEEVDAARAAHATAVEQSRGIDRAISIVRERRKAHEAEIDRQHKGIAAIVKTLAEPLLPGVLSAVEYHASNLGLSLATLYRLQNAIALGAGFITGEAAHNFAGCPGYLLSQHGMRCDDGRIYPQLRDRSDDLRPIQLLELLKNS